MCGVFFMRAELSHTPKPSLLPLGSKLESLFRDDGDRMLSPKTQTNLANARSYFQEHLCVSDYYTESERVRGEWLGRSAEMLELNGLVARDDFVARCERRYFPATALHVGSSGCIFQATVCGMMSLHLMTKEELRAALNLPSTRMVDELVRKRKIPVIRLGHRTVRFDVATVAAALARLERKAIGDK